MASKPPDAFLSYTRFDDQHDGGAISEFCRRLASAVRAVTGVPFKIFQDVGGIGIGEHWPGKLDEMLNEARFFIPIVTPSYFTSKACREELENFLRAEAERQRNDLVLPIYYIECELLEDDDLRAGDALAKTLHERQRQDWRELRFESFDAPEVRRALERLARNIVKAHRRPNLPRSMLQPGATIRQRAVSLIQPPATSQHTKEPSKVAVGSLTVGTVFRDVDEPWCPELVVIPPGEFMMGSPDDAPDVDDDEKPQHLVRIAYPLAVGRFPVTFEEYDHFVTAMRGEQPKDEGWGRGRRPVVNVSWHDAKTYVEWLASETGQFYRLLSESEWEYACRAGTTTRFWWGNEILPEKANFIGTRLSEVGSYAPNPWGLYDMNGNVWEWVEDCWNQRHEPAPDDGRPRTTGDCSSRVLRGGSWNYNPSALRSGDRYRRSTADRNHFTGFRVARTLAAQPAANPEGNYWSKLQYHDPELTGQVTFNYSNNNGVYSIGRDEFFFETKWSKASDRSIHLVSDPPSIAGVAEAPDLRSYRSVTDLASYDMSSRVRTIQEGEHAILKNSHGKYAVLKVLDVKDRTRLDTVDELTFEFYILADTT